MLTSKAQMRGEQIMPNASTNTVEAPLALAAARHNINLDVLVTSAFLRSLPQLGEVVLATIPQSIIAILAGAAGANVTYVMNKNLCDQRGNRCSRRHFDTVIGNEPHR